jgi:hypothetical protein
LKEYFYIKGEPSKYSNAGFGTFEENIHSGSPFYFSTKDSSKIPKCFFHLSRIFVKRNSIFVFERIFLY